MKVKIIYTLFSYALSLVLANSGVISFKTNPEFWPIGLSFVASSFLILYFLNYLSKINENENNIQNIKEEIQTLKQEIYANEKLLNTIKDVILIKNIKKK